MPIMDRIELYDSIVYDFFASIFRLNCNEKLIFFSEDFDMKANIKPNEEILKWVKETNDKIPTNMKDKIDKFFNWETFYGMCLVPLIHVYRPKDIIDFINYLEGLTYADILIRFIRSGYVPEENEITKDNIDKLLQDEKEAMQYINNNLSIPSKDKWELLQFFLDPEKMKADLITLLRWYYENIFKYEIANVKEIIQKRIGYLKERLDKYGESYLKIITHTEYCNDAKFKRIILTMSYFYEFSSFNGGYNDDDVYMLGYRFPEIYAEGKHALLSNVQMFKALADETRLNIIKLLSLRPWYGHELAKELNLSNSTISYHMSMLVVSNIVELKRIEKKSYFTLDIESMKKNICASIDKMLT